MFLWRISNHATLDGRRGFAASARWHTEGRAIVYLAENPAGALIEALVHLEISPARFPKAYRLLKGEAPDDSSISAFRRSDLPPIRQKTQKTRWVSDHTVTRTIGDECLASRSTALLRVPSAIVPETFNILLNPAHPDARCVQVLWHEEYPWDARLLGAHQD